MSSSQEGGQPERAFPAVAGSAAETATATSSSDAQAADAAGPSSGTRYFATALVAAAVGGAAGYLLKPPPIVETAFVNFDAESTPAQVLGEGWSTFEHFEDGVTFAWCSAVRCTLNVASTGKQGRLVRARLLPFRYEGAPPQSVTVYLNGTKIGSQPVTDGPLRTLAFPASQQYWLPGTNALSFEFAYAKDPKSVVPGANDGRTLAASFDWVEIIPK